MLQFATVAEDPAYAFVPLEWLQQQLDSPGRANAILCAGSPSALHPQLTDYGISVQTHSVGLRQRHFRRMMFDPASEREIVKALDDLPSPFGRGAGGEGLDSPQTPSP